MKRNRHRPSIKVDNRKRKQRVAARPGGEVIPGLLNRGTELSAMPEFSETAVLDPPCEINVGLDAVVVVDGNRDGVACPRLRLSSVDQSQRRQGADDELGLHALFSFRLPFIRLTPKNSRTSPNRGITILDLA